MSSPTVTRSGRCSRCLGYTDTAGCPRCWPNTMSEAARAVLSEEDQLYPPIPELVTGFVSEEQIPAAPRFFKASAD